MTLYKATRPDGTDFRTATIGYAAALGTGQPVTWTAEHLGAGKHPFTKDDPATYFSLSSEPGEVLTGGEWPCRLFEVQALGRTMSHSVMEFKVCCRQVLVLAELPAHVALGPNGQEVAALIERAGKLTAVERKDLAAAWDAAWDAARDAAWDAARAAARDAARDAARAAAGAAARAAAGAAAWDAAGAAEALIVRDLISPEQFAVLHGPWAEAVK